MELALQISLVSAAISCIALGWNIVRDVVLRPKLIVKLKAEINRDSSRSEGDGYEETFRISGTITPLKFRTTIEKLSLEIPSYPTLKKFGQPPLQFSVSKIVDSGERCEINWYDQGVLRALHKTRTAKKLIVHIHHSAADKPYRKKLQLTIH